MKLTSKQIQDIIDDEITVDCYDDWEVQAGWAIFLTDHINYPFEAEYQVQSSNGKQWKKVTIVNNKTTEDSFGGRGFYVNVEYNDILIPANLLELRQVKADEETLRTIAVWRYERKGV